MQIVKNTTILFEPSQLLNRKRPAKVMIYLCRAFLFYINVFLIYSLFFHKVNVFAFVLCEYLAVSLTRRTRIVDIARHRSAASCCITVAASIVCRRRRRRGRRRSRAVRTVIGGRRTSVSHSTVGEASCCITYTMEEIRHHSYYEEGDENEDDEQIFY